MSQEERYFTLNNQVLDLSQLTIPGRILDIGGGGEGVMGRIFGEQVVAVDPLQEELEEAPEGPLKIVMDAKNLGFIDKSFDAVTSFFTLMYVPQQHHEKIFSEIYRVLRPGGNFFIWDAEIPEFPGGNQDIFVIPMTINLQKNKIDTGYGISWPGREQNLRELTALGKNTGFQVVTAKTTDKVFKLTLRK